jgi:hypothetical protein
MQEILVVAAVAVAVFFLPRWLGRKPEPEPVPRYRVLSSYLPGWMRLAIVITFLWIAGFVVYLKPWQENALLIFSVSMMPAVAFWGGVWVWFGYKKYRR